jgi:hypothetical protein
MSNLVPVDIQAREILRLGALVGDILSSRQVLPALGAVDGG